MNKDEAERMVGRAVMESMKRSAQVREMLKKVLGDVMENVPSMEEGYELPNADLMDFPEEIVVFVDLPGARKEDVELGITEDSITVEVKFHRAEGRYLRRERCILGMKREIALPEDVKPEQVTAKYENGVLEVHLPKLIVVKPHRVSVE